MRRGHWQLEMDLRFPNFVMVTVQLSHQTCFVHHEFKSIISYYCKKLRSASNAACLKMSANKNSCSVQLLLSLWFGFGLFLLWLTSFSAWLNGAGFCRTCF